MPRNRENPAPLNARQLAFIDELLTDPNRNGTAAARRAGYSDKGAGNIAYELLQDARVKAIIAARDADRIERLKLSADDVALQVAEIAKADPRDLMEYWRGACRHCHGFEFKYQRTPEEYRRDLRAHVAARAAKDHALGPDPLGLDLDPLGGLGFTPRRDPHPDCPECFGLGVGYEVIKDTRTLTPGAARLYAGLKTTKEGIEIKTRSQDKAIEMAARMNGQFVEKRELTGKGGAPLVPAKIVIDWGDDGGDSDE